jgi:hypothetical protein
MIQVAATAKESAAVVFSATCGSVHRVLLWCHRAGTIGAFEASPKVLLLLSGNPFWFCQ